MAKLYALALAVLLALSAAGCANRDLFDCCDRYCYAADWANCHSCVNRNCHRGSTAAFVP